MRALEIQRQQILFNALYTKTMLNGGVTINTQDGSEPTKGFAVSTDILFRGLSEETYRAVEPVFEAVAQGVAYLGGWKDVDTDGIIEFSATKVFDSQVEAVTFARTTGEKYVYDLSNGEQIRA